MPYPHRQKWFHRDEPDIVVTLKARRHDKDFLRELEEKARRRRRRR